MASGGDSPFLPSEVIINILKRLPVKSIVRFRCVCEEWKNLFKTSYFISEHSRHSAYENPLLLLHESDLDYKGTSPSLRLVNHKMETVEILRIPSIDCLRHGWRIISSCNGLLCIEVDLDRVTSPCSLCLWNPLIREVREIPLTQKDDQGFSVFGFGFGFSSVVNDYKIVKFFRKKELCKKKNKKKNGALHGAEVYSLSTGSWKELAFGALHNTKIASKAVSADGTIRWLGVQDSFHVVISFDIMTEEFTLTPIPLPLPSVDRAMSSRTTLGGVYQNKFAIFHHYGDDSFNSIDIWVMEEAAGQTGKSFSIIEECKIDTISWFFHPLCIWRNQIVCRDKDIDDPDEDEPQYFLQLFNVTTKKWKTFHKAPEYDYCAGFNYERSLALL